MSSEFDSENLPSPTPVSIGGGGYPVESGNINIQSTAGNITMQSPEFIKLDSSVKFNCKEITTSNNIDPSKYIIENKDFLVACTNPSVNIIELPEACDNKGKYLIISKRYYTNILTIIPKPTSSDTINGDLSLILSSALKLQVSLMSSGCDSWIII